MPLTPLVHVTLPDLADNSIESHFAPVVLLLEGPIKVNEFHISRSLKRAARGEGVPIPPLYASGVVYAEDPAGREDWRDVYSVLEKGTGDCDNLVCWRVAELRVAGIAAEPVIKWQHLTQDTAVGLGYPSSFVPPEGLWLVHCCVRWPDGHVEDPSKLLGMGANFSNKA